MNIDDNEYDMCMEGGHKKSKLSLKSMMATVIEMLMVMMKYS